MQNIKTPSDLKYYVEEAGRDPHFFDRETMRFFGDTMKNYAVRQPREIHTRTGEKVLAYELMRKKPVKFGKKSSAFFDANTFQRVFPW
jgi:hypothetical protein